MKDTSTIDLTNFDLSGLNSFFTGRSNEMDRLVEVFSRKERPRPVQISGSPGIGKSTLVELFLKNNPRLTGKPFRIQAPPIDKWSTVLDRFDELYRQEDASCVIADSVEHIPELQLEQLIRKALNWKVTRGVIFTSRIPKIIPYAEHIELQRFSHAETISLMNKLMHDQKFDPLLKNQIAEVTGGYPMLAHLLVHQIRDRSLPEIEAILRGDLYDFTREIALPEEQIIQVVRPQIISAGDRFIEAIQKEPESIHQLSPRNFEEVIADILSDKGWDIELTPETRDGGKDILARLDTDLGKILCLVEAKRYREDRKIGVELVRTLYGTLHDHDASSAMMVTTSSFTSGARDFESKYEYRLALRDKMTLLEWVRDYKK